jgi:ferredoxin
MIDLGKLADLAELWSGSPPGVIGDHCLNVRHRGRNCRICVEACPANAISIPDGAGAGVLDQDTCVRCGLCLNACPTGVFVQTEPPESKLGQLITHSPNQVIELACLRKEPPELSQVPEAAVVQTPRCLAALSVPTLIELTTTGKTLWLNDSICHACPIGVARQTIEGNITAANRWLQVMGHASAIRSYLYGTDELADEATPRPVIRGERAALSRRDFFKSLTSRTGQATGGFITEREEPRPERASGPPANRRNAKDGAGHPLSHHIPTQRHHLARALRRLSPNPMTQVPTAALPIADVTVSDSCTACGLCAQFCPTEAITFLSDGEYYVLHFSAALCLGEECGLCIIGCPTDAVHFGQEVIADELLSTQPRPLKAGRLAPCPQCGAPTDAPAPEGEDEYVEVPLCHICQAQATSPDYAR